MIILCLFRRVSFVEKYVDVLHEVVIDFLGGLHRLSFSEGIQPIFVGH